MTLAAFKPKEQCLQTCHWAHNLMCGSRAWLGRETQLSRNPLLWTLGYQKQFVMMCPLFKILNGEVDYKAIVVFSNSSFHGFSLLLLWNLVTTLQSAELRCCWLFLQVFLTKCSIVLKCSLGSLFFFKSSLISDKLPTFLLFQFLWNSMG